MLIKQYLYINSNYKRRVANIGNNIIYSHIVVIWRYSISVTRWGTEYFNLNNWAGYVDKINRQDQGWLLWLLIKCLPNRLTPLHSEIHYKEENYLKVKTTVFKYINSSIVKFGTLVRWYI